MTDVELSKATPGQRRRWVPALASLCGAAVVAAATVVQVWFAPFAVGLAVGGFTRRRHGGTPVAVLAVTVASLVGWAVPLLWRALAGEPVVAAARATAALAGLPASGSLLIAVTLLVAVVQGLLGVWLGHAVGRLRRSTGDRRESRAATPAPAGLPDVAPDPAEGSPSPPVARSQPGPPSGTGAGSEVQRSGV